MRGTSVSISTSSPSVAVNIVSQQRQRLQLRVFKLRDEFFRVFGQEFFKVAHSLLALAQPKVLPSSEQLGFLVAWLALSISTTNRAGCRV